MTADEIVFAGGRASTYWWLLSPYLWSSDGYSAVTYVGGSDFPGGLSYGNVDISFGIHGIVSLDSCAKVTGTGAPEDPYIIDEKNSTC